MREHASRKDKVRSVLDVVAGGRLSLSKVVEVEPVDPTTSEEELTPEEDLLPGIKPDYERFLPPSPYSLEENLEKDPDYLRKCLVDTLINMSWAFDSLDHQTSSVVGGTEVQHDCLMVRELASKLASELCQST